MHKLMRDLQISRLARTRMNAIRTPPYSGKPQFPLARHGSYTAAA